MGAEKDIRSRRGISSGVISKETIVLTGTLNVVGLENRPAALRGTVYGR